MSRSRHVDRRGEDHGEVRQPARMVELQAASAPPYTTKPCVSFRPDDERPSMNRFGEFLIRDSEEPGLDGDRGQRGQDDERGVVRCHHRRG